MMILDTQSREPPLSVSFLQPRESVVVMEDYDDDSENKLGNWDPTHHLLLLKIHLGINPRIEAVGFIYGQGSI